jgi:hypothetical protein
LRSGRGLKTLAYAAVLGCFAVFAAGSAAQGAQSPAPAHVGGIVPAPNQATRLMSSKANACDYVPFCAQVTYHGGPVMNTSTTHAIYWLPSGYTSGDGMQPYDTNYQSVIAQYFTDLETVSGALSNVYGVDTQYCNGVSFGASSCSGALPGNLVTTNQTYGGAYVDTSTPFPADGCTDPTSEAAHCLSDAQLQTEISHVINVMGWPKGTSNIYFLFTPEGVESCYDPSACAYDVYCAYHGYFGSGSNTVVYANQPYPKLANDPFLDCGTGQRPNGDIADEELNVASHEHREAITDATLDAWYANANGGYETSDQCAWDFGSESGTNGARYNQTINGHHYDLQLEWSNDGSDCLASYGSTTGGSAPTVRKVSPSHGVVGQPIKINGKNLDGATTVAFNATDAASFAQKGNTITAPVPVGATTGQVHVTTPAGTADGPVFTVEVSPVPTLKLSKPIKPALAHVGSMVTLAGKGFWGTSAVKVNGVDVASFTVKSAAKLTFVVAGGNTTGQVSVTTPGGTVVSVGTLTIS